MFNVNYYYLMFWMVLSQQIAPACKWRVDWKGPCPAQAQPQELSTYTEALFGLSYLDDPRFVPPKSNLLYLVHTRLSLLSYWQQERWDSYLHGVCFPLLVVHGALYTLGIPGSNFLLMARIRSSVVILSDYVKGRRKTLHSLRICSGRFWLPHNKRQLPSLMHLLDRTQ